MTSKRLSLAITRNGRALLDEMTRRQPLAKLSTIGRVAMEMGLKAMLEGSGVTAKTEPAPSLDEEDDGVEDFLASVRDEVEGLS